MENNRKIQVNCMLISNLSFLLNSFSLLKQFEIIKMPKIYRIFFGLQHLSFPKAFQFGYLHSGWLFIFLRLKTSINICLFLFFWNEKHSTPNTEIAVTYIFVFGI